MSDPDIEYQNDPRTACKYGESCYQKNPQHHSRFKHPPKRKLSEGAVDDDVETKPKKTKTEENQTEADESGDNFAVPSSDLKDDFVDSPLHEHEAPPSPENIRESIEQKFLLDMPDDFFDFWEFCKTINKEKPEEALVKAGLTLVGPYDVLTGKLKSIKNRKISNYVCHWRYYYDPPEFMTVLAGDINEYHIGYYRDDCFLLPDYLGSMSCAKPGIISVMGENIFGAVNTHLILRMRSENPFKKTGLQRLAQQLVKFAKSKDYSTDQRTPALMKRGKTMVSRCFHGGGIVVPVDEENDVGYRPIPETAASLRKIFQKVVDSKSEQERMKNFDAVQELMTNVQFAFDEGDFGMGLEFGLNMFTFGGEEFHKSISHILGVAYELLGRDAFNDILQAHLQNRRRGGNMSILEDVN